MGIANTFIIFNNKNDDNDDDHDGRDGDGGGGALVTVTNIITIMVTVAFAIAITIVIVIARQRSILISVKNQQRGITGVHHKSEGSRWISAETVNLKTDRSCYVYGKKSG